MVAIQKASVRVDTRLCCIGYWGVNLLLLQLHSDEHAVVRLEEGVKCRERRVV